MKTKSLINSSRLILFKEAVLSKRFWLSDFAIIGYIALAKLVLHLVAIQGYGYFRDELYYIACSDHLAFGYVDHPSLSIFLLKIVRLLFGDSLVAIRILPVISGALFVFFTGLIARELSGRKFAMILASIAAFAQGGNFFFFNIYSMNFLDLLFWLVCIFIIIRIIKTNNPRNWLLFGLVAGLGLQNKISVLFLCFGIFVGVVLTNNRRYFKSRFLWLSGAVAGFIFLPYILWNVTNAWPTLEFMHNARTYKMAEVAPFEFLMNQILYNNPATLIIWLAGLWYFFFNKEGKKYRLFGWMYLSIYLLFTIQEAKAYYLAGAYPILFAAGAVFIETWLRKKKWRWPKSALVAFILIPTLIFCPVILPILPVETTAKLAQSLGIHNRSGENHREGILPQHFADMHGWENMVNTMAKVYRTLSPEEQSQCLIYVRNYGQAGAIDFFGKKYNLPNATCAHNNYWFWGPDDHKGEIVIIIGMSSNLQISLEDLKLHFEKVDHAATIRCKYCMPYENNRPIFICRGFKGSIQKIWADEKFYI